MAHGHELGGANQEDEGDAGDDRLNASHTGHTATKALAQKSESPDVSMDEFVRRNPGFSPPSTKYREVESLSAAKLRRALKPPKPSLPRRSVHDLAAGTQKAQKSPAGNGASRCGQIAGTDDGRYEGELMAGRPHGQGQYWVAVGPADELRLQYDGAWSYGRMEGYGVYYYRSGEVYSGSFANNKRHGLGKLEYLGGDVFVGTFSNDVRHGDGELYLARTGHVFRGTWSHDLREGLGTMFYVSHARKCDGEWRNGELVCGSLRDMEQAELQRYRDWTSQTPAQVRVRSRLPQTELALPENVLYQQVFSAREEREAGRKAATDAIELTHTYTHKELAQFRHAFMLIAGDEDGGVQRDQVRELAVLAGLDASATHVQALLHSLRAQTARDGQVGIEDALRTFALHRKDM